MESLAARVAVVIRPLFVIESLRRARVRSESVVIVPLFEMVLVRALSMTAFVLLKFVTVPFVAKRLSVTVFVALIERLFKESDVIVVALTVFKVD
jgi:hypothetical protein